MRPELRLGLLESRAAARPFDLIGSVDACAFARYG
jgi:hypothetical protein